MARIKVYCPQCEKANKEDAPKCCSCGHWLVDPNKHEENANPAAARLPAISPGTLRRLPGQLLRWGLQPVRLRRLRHMPLPEHHPGVAAVLSFVIPGRWSTVQRADFHWACVVYWRGTRIHDVGDTGARAAPLLHHLCVGRRPVQVVMVADKHKLRRVRKQPIGSYNARNFVLGDWFRSQYP